MEQFTVAIPAGVGPGQVIQAQTPDGQTVQCQVPAGYGPGMTMPVAYTPLSSMPSAAVPLAMPVAAPMQQGMMQVPGKVRYSGVTDAWALLSGLPSIKIKEKQEELEKLHKEAWVLIQAERYEEAFAYKRRAEDIEQSLESLKAEEAKARQKHRVARDAALASKGIVAIPSKGDRIMALQEELEQARAAGDFERTIEARKSMLALQDGAGSSSSSGARPTPALPAPEKVLAITDATNPDFDPREEGAVADFEIPVPKRNKKPIASETGLTGRAAERFKAMRVELQEALDNGDEAAAADARRRLEIFRAEFLDKKEDVKDPSAELEARPRRVGRKGGGKGRGKAREEQAALGDRQQAPPAKGKGKARPKPAGAHAQPDQPAPPPLSAEQLRAKKQVEAWERELVLLEEGLVDYRGDEGCKEALDLRRRMDDMNGKIRDLEAAAAADGPVLQAALRAIDQANNPDTREAQLAAFAKLNKALHKS